MQTTTITHRASHGWRSPLPTALDSPQTLVLAFGASTLAPGAAAFADLAAAFPQAVVLGCSTAGEIAGNEVADGSLSVAPARFDHTRLALAAADVAQAALSQGLGGRVAISGGLAGDGSAFQRTWVLEGGQVGSGCRGGWMDFGPERCTTRSTGNVLHELDGKPALDLYKADLGELVQGHAARLMRITNDSLIDSAAEASARAVPGGASDLHHHTMNLTVFSAH